MLKLSDLAGKSDFTAGPLRVSPSRRLVEGPAGSTHLEPIVMKVFLLLLDAGGNVVTRDELFGSAWGGVFVGDDSLNRAIARVRKVASETAPGLFEIETIPRTGYRLTGAIIRALELREGEPADAIGPAAVSRRAWIGGAAGAVVALGGAGWWWAARPRSGARFDALMERGQSILDNSSVSGDQRTIAVFEEAVSIRPQSARAWGLLGLVRSLASQESAGDEAARLVDAARTAAGTALQIDPNEPNALLAMFELKGSTLDWIDRDRALRQILALDARNIVAMTELVALLQAAGLNRESWEWNERAIALQPLSPDLLGRRSLKLWIGGHVSEADKVIDQVRDLYPSNRWSWWVRFLILSLTDRAAAAQALLAAEPGKLEPAMAAMWRATLPALARPGPAAIAAARKACIDVAAHSGQLAAHAVMILGALGEVDAAFEITDGFLLWRGPVVRVGERKTPRGGTDAGWRVGVQWLFTPPCAGMRADPRFLSLCDDVGLTDYWHARGVRPDYQRT